MKVFKRRGWLLAVIFLLSGCAGKDVGKLVVENAEPIKDVSVVMWMSDISNISTAKPKDVEFYRVVLKDALKTRLPAIFEVNGIDLKRFTLSERYVSKRDIEFLLDNVRSSHLLILNAKRVEYRTVNGRRESSFFVYFDTFLFDVNKKLRVWEGEPYLSTYIKQPLLRSQLFAGELIRGLNDGGLVKLKTSNVVDLEGKSINVYFIWEDDR